MRFSHTATNGREPGVLWRKGDFRLDTICINAQYLHITVAYNPQMISCNAMLLLLFSCLSVYWPRVNRNYDFCALFRFFGSYPLGNSTNWKIILRFNELDYSRSKITRHFYLSNEAMEVSPRDQRNASVHVSTLFFLFSS